MRILVHIITACVLVGTVAACGRTEKNKDRAEARDLYRKSVTLVRAYTDSLRNAKDSATIERLEKELDAAMTHLNYEYSPDVATSISEGENDSLTNLTLHYAHLRDSLLYRLAHPITIPDSIPTDPAPHID